MLKAYASDASGLRAIDDPTGAVWIDLVNPTPEEAAAAAKITGFTVPTQANVSEIESSSRLATRGGALYLNMPTSTAPTTVRVPRQSGSCYRPSIC